MQRGWGRIPKREKKKFRLIIHPALPRTKAFPGTFNDKIRSSQKIEVIVNPRKERWRTVKLINDSYKTTAKVLNGFDLGHCQAHFTILCNKAQSLILRSLKSRWGTQLLVLLPPQSPNHTHGKQNPFINIFFFSWVPPTVHLLGGNIYVGTHDNYIIVVIFY